MKLYNVLLPRLDCTGPCNIAIDICREAKRRGYVVKIFALSDDISRSDLGEFDDVRCFSIRDIFTIKGVLHTHCLRPDLIGGLIAILGKCTVITTIHNYFLLDLSFDHKRWEVVIFWHIWKRAVAKMSAAICISNAMHRYYRKKIPTAQLETVYNFCSIPSEPYAADLLIVEENFTPWLKLQRYNGRKVLAFIGSIHARKNPLSLIREIAKHPQVALVLCGDGPLLAKAQQLIFNLNCSSRIITLGSVSRPDLILVNCDALVLPSYAEGMPLVVLEAARLGKPSLLSNIAVHREMAKLGLGVTFDHHTYSDFNKAIKILNNLNSFNINIHSLWNEKFNPSVGFDKYKKIINKYHIQ